MLFLAGLCVVLAFVANSFGRSTYTASLEDLIDSEKEGKEKESFRKKFFAKTLTSNAAVAVSLFLAACAGYFVTKAATSPSITSEFESSATE